MNRLFQLAALALVLLMGATPVLAAVPCANGAMAPGCCGAGCAMMAGTASASVASQPTAVAVHAMPATQACCHNGAAHAAEFVEPKVPTAPAALSPQTLSHSVAMVPVVTPMQRQARLFMPVSSPSPAHLCTFLI